jgi:hypothetical protein
LIVVERAKPKSGFRILRFFIHYDVIMSRRLQTFGNSFADMPVSQPDRHCRGRRNLRSNAISGESGALPVRSCRSQATRCDLFERVMLSLLLLHRRGQLVLNLYSTHCGSNLSRSMSPVACLHQLTQSGYYAAMQIPVALPNLCSNKQVTVLLKLPKMQIDSQSECVRYR